MPNQRLTEPRSKKSSHCADSGVGTGLKAAAAQRLLDRTQEDMQRLERKTLFFQEHSGSAKFLCHEIDH
jgi:hypothetical protein